jgi:hypothetical protein
MDVRTSYSRHAIAGEPQANAARAYLGAHCILLEKIIHNLANPARASRPLRTPGK